MILCHYQKRVKWYIKENDTLKYLPKSKLKVAQKYAYKKYLQLRLAMLQNELSIIFKIIPKYEKARNEYLEALLDHHFSDLLIPYGIGKVNNDSWENSPYPSNPYHPEKKIFNVTNTLSVRSKSELIIAMTLKKYGIPFRYECALEISGITYYPDFTINILDTRATFYWEHFGLMDDEDYKRHAIQKIRTYADNGIYPMKNLIITYETHDEPLDYSTVEKIIKLYFLD